MKEIFKIKDNKGNVVFTAIDSNFALSYYYDVRNKFGYAEVWYGEKLIFKTR